MDCAYHGTCDIISHSLIIGLHIHRSGVAARNVVQGKIVFRVLCHQLTCRPPHMPSLILIFQQWCRQAILPCWLCSGSPILHIPLNRRPDRQNSISVDQQNLACSCPVQSDFCRPSSTLIMHKCCLFHDFCTYKAY